MKKDKRYYVDEQGNFVEIKEKTVLGLFSLPQNNPLIDPNEIITDDTIKELTNNRGEENE